MEFHNLSGGQMLLIGLILKSIILLVWYLESPNRSNRDNLNQTAEILKRTNPEFYRKHYLDGAPGQNPNGGPTSHQTTSQTDHPTRDQNGRPLDRE